MLKVLHVISDTNIGGAGRHLLAFLQYYDRSRLEVRVLCPPGSRLAGRCLAAGVEVITRSCLSGEKSFDLRGLAGLAALIKKYRIQVVHTHASFTGRLAARLAGVPCVVYTKHRLDWERPQKGIRGRLLNYLDRTACHRVIAVSRAVKESLLKSGMPEARVEVIYNGIDVGGFRERARPGRLREELSAGADRVVGIIGRLEPEKGHSIFLQAAAQVLKVRNNVTFVVVGTGSLAGELKNMARDLGIETKVLFTGLREDIPELLSVMDVVALPSLTEAFPLSLIESMCLGRPCIASSVGGISEIIENEKNGLLVSPGDAAALAEKIIFLLSNPEQARAMGVRAAALVEKKFDAGLMAEKITDLYYRVVYPR
ncbi:MAG: glycosyltransferase [Peptococcaceae bacterium]|jgi:glycosyltransferase involved in cell wall biosynthesis|nr:MAG: glycosyltransferase [Peptococcaceae bacterium]